jgi:hypothetical protein
MQQFSFARFAMLLIRVLEISIVAALLLDWVAFFVDIRYRVAAAGTASDVAENVAFLAIVVLLVGDLWLLLTRRPHAVFATMRTFVYIVAFAIGPHRLGGGSFSEAARMPNQSMEPTASRRTIQLSVSSTHSYTATHALVRGSSSHSR